MTICDIAPFVGRKVAAILNDGSNHIGELRQDRREDGVYHVVTWSRRTGAIQETGPQVDLLARDIVAIMDVDEQERYLSWCTKTYQSIRSNRPAITGNPVDDRGDFENVSFQIAADYGLVGDGGGVTVTIWLKGWKRRVGTVKANWRHDKPEGVAGSAIAYYAELLR
jgi:hypothetical protein